MVAKSVKVTRKGQITLPVELRREFGIEEGDIVYIQKGERGIEIRTPGNFATRTAGIFREYASTMLPLEPGEIDQLAAQAWTEDTMSTMKIGPGDE